MEVSTCCPDFIDLLFVLDDKVEDITSIVSPQVQPKTQESCVGHQEVHTFGWAGWSTAQSSCRQNLKLI